MDVIYYYCFLFYTRILKDDSPHTTTVWALGFAEGFFANVILYSFLIYYFGITTLNTWIMMFFVAIFVLANHLYFKKSGRAKKIVKEKPMFYSSQKISIIITSVFFILLISSMFWGPFYIKYLSDKYCK
jgi:hypothetical protein